MDQFPSPHPVESIPPDLTPPEPPQPRAPLDADLSGDLPCVVCRYNLRGLSILSVCPECGTRIRATILAHVDPHAAELRPVRRPKLLAASIILWAVSAAAAALVCWVPQAQALWSGFGRQGPGALVDIRLVATALVALSGLGAAGMLAPQRPTPRSHIIAAALAVLAYIPLAWGVWSIALFTSEGEIGVLGRWPPLTSRTLWHLLAGAMVAIISLAMRPNARLLVARSLVLRTGRVDRQTLLAVAAAAGVWVLGDVILLIVTPMTGFSAQVGRILAIVLVAIGSVLVTLGCIGALVDSLRITASILRPAPSLDQLVSPAPRPRRAEPASEQPGAGR